MSNEEKLFDTDTINYVSQLVESKSHILREKKDFKEKDKILSLSMEKFEKELSPEKKGDFDEIIKLIYQIEEYYMTLAYMIGTKYGTNIEKI